MSPPSYRDWWFAAALTSTVFPVGIAQAADAQPPVGIVTALNPSSASIDNNDTLHVGSGVTSGMRLKTHGEGPLHVLFLDQSALTLGPDSELVIDEFSYDADNRQGQIRIGLNRGSLRIVGGHISKNNAAVITTPDTTVEVLGGITLVSVSGNFTQSTFLFGQQMRVSNDIGSQTVTRPGFSVSTHNGGPSSPTRIDPQQLTNQLAQLERTEARPDQPPVPPTPPQPLVSFSDRPSSPNLPEQQLAPDRVRFGTDSTQQANPTLVLNNLLNSNSSTVQS